jgi:hypothetical protein
MIGGIQRELQKLSYQCSMFHSSEDGGGGGHSLSLRSHGAVLLEKLEYMYVGMHVCMYVCMYIYVYVYIHTYIYMHVYIYVLCIYIYNMLLGKLE